MLLILQLLSILSISNSKHNNYKLNQGLTPIKKIQINPNKQDSSLTINHCNKITIKRKVLLIVTLIANLNKNNNKMKTTKSPKLMNYARQSKQKSNKKVPGDENKKIQRNSASNVCNEILGQSSIAQNKDICEPHQKDKQLISGKETPIDRDFPSRRKSYADLDVSSLSRESRQKQSCKKDKHKSKKDTMLLQESIPTYTCTPIQTQQLNTNANNHLQSQSSEKKEKYNSCRRESFRKEKAFLDNLENYLTQLIKPSEHISQVKITDKLSETLKISDGSNQSFKLVSKLEQSHIKIKELKLKTYYQQKELLKCGKRQEKMKNSLYDMLSEMRELTAELNRERKQRDRLQRIIDNFEISKLKLERKTIGKISTIKRDYNLQEYTEHYQDDSDLDFSIRQEWKNATAERRRAKQPIRISFENFKSRKNSEQIQKLIHSSYQTSESDNE